jgi:hypothetical protein
MSNNFGRKIKRHSAMKPDKRIRRLTAFLSRISPTGKATRRRILKRSARLEKYLAGLREESANSESLFP